MEDIKKAIAQMLKEWGNMDYIKPSDIPNIDLYMDQVTTFMDENLGDTKRNEEDKILTKTMINNYTKNDLIPPPMKKKYSKDHMLLLIYIYYFKNILSINDIRKLFNPLIDLFYQNKNKCINLEEIYELIFNLHKEQVDFIIEDIEKKINIASTSFPQVKEENQKLLFLYSFISLLTFETYMKKQMIEKLIDQFFQDEDEEEKKK